MLRDTWYKIIAFLDDDKNWFLSVICKNVQKIITIRALTTIFSIIRNTYSFNFVSFFSYKGSEASLSTMGFYMNFFFSLKWIKEKSRVGWRTALNEIYDEKYLLWRSWFSFFVVFFHQHFSYKDEDWKGKTERDDKKMK